MIVLCDHPPYWNLLQGTSVISHSNPVDISRYSLILKLVVYCGFKFLFRTSLLLYCVEMCSEYLTCTWYIYYRNWKKNYHFPLKFTQCTPSITNALEILLPSFHCLLGFHSRSVVGTGLISPTLILARMVDTSWFDGCAEHDCFLITALSQCSIFL